LGLLIKPVQPEAIYAFLAATTTKEP